MTRFTIGTNSGIVWQTLHANEKELTFDELAQLTGLDATNLAAAIGWLAREEKIDITQKINGECYEVFKECYY